ncbi:MAG: hypothetical protein WCL06_08640 [Bacteroidota bacterium]
MKKLLLLASTLVFVIVIASCCSQKKTETGNAGGTNNAGIESYSVSDTSKSGHQTTESSATAGMDGGIKKDSLPSHGNGTAIIHHAPDQAKIDSIKNAKTKTKK